MATYTRTNAWNNGGTFNNPVLLWYAKGVGVMQSRKLNNTSSWWFFAGIHGQRISQSNSFPDWTTLPGPPAVPTTPLPGQADRKLYWDQCQHQTWYFAPWHRGYLIALEKQVRAAIVSLGGPATWALPYWNYFKANQSKMPPAFGQPNLPDGSPNPLFVKARYGPDFSGNVFVPIGPAAVNQECMKNDLFTGDDALTPPPGFGGPKTQPLFSHNGGTNGNLENNPHNLVHGLVGGRTQQGDRGLMSHPLTAGLDPIFYLHHANIDRMWAAWNGSSTHKNPTANAWLKGPPSNGERKFAMPLPSGSWVYTPEQMSNLGQLDYTYDDLQAPAPPVNPLTGRLVRLGVPPDEAASAEEEVTPMITGKKIELLGASPKAIKLQPNGARTTVKLDSDVRSKVSRSLTAAAATKKPDRVFLELENVRGTGDGEVLNVYVNLPAGANPDEHPELLAGSAGLFGVSQATEPDSQHGGAGLNFVMDITKIVDELHLNNALNTDSLGISVVPFRTMHESAEITVGRVNIYRKGD